MIDPAMRAVLTVLVMLAFISASACTTFTEINRTPESIHENIELGDVVKVTTTDRRKLEFEVVAINSQSISGDDEQVLFSDIDKIEKEKVNAARTTAETVSTAAAVVAVALIVLTVVAVASLNAAF